MDNEILIKEINREILIKEQIKYKKIEDDAKALVRGASDINMKLKHQVLTESERKQYEQRIKDIRAERDVILEKLKSQKNLIETIEQTDVVTFYENIMRIYMDENIALRQEIETLKKEIDKYDNH